MTYNIKRLLEKKEYISKKREQLDKLEKDIDYHLNYLNK